MCLKRDNPQVREWIFRQFKGRNPKLSSAKVEPCDTKKWLSATRCVLRNFLRHTLTSRLKNRRQWRLIGNVPRAVAVTALRTVRYATLSRTKSHVDVPLKRFLDALLCTRHRCPVAELALGLGPAHSAAVGRLAAQHNQIAVSDISEDPLYLLKGAPYFDRNYYSAKGYPPFARFRLTSLISPHINAHENYENTQEPLALNNTLRKVYNITYHIVNTILADYQGKSIHMIIQANCIYIRCVCTTLLWRNERKKS